MNELPAVMAAAAALILLGVGASKISARLGVPALLLFIGVGMLAGSEGLGGIEFDDYEAAQSVGVVALAFILFAGGLDTDWGTVRRALRPALLLATIGVLITAGVSGVAASWVLGVPLTVGLLLGAIVSSTDAAAVFSVLRAHSVGLTGRLRPLLELESGSNDPMAVFLTLGLVQLVTEPDASVLDLVPVFFAQMAVGSIVGLAVAKLLVIGINRVPLEYEGLYPVVMIACVLLTYGVAAVLGGSGFLAVYVAGLLWGNSRFLHRRSLTRFADGIAWLMQITMFLALGLLVFPSQVVPVAGRALLLSLVLILVARPVAVLVALAPAHIRFRETLMVSWVGLRGAVPIILATFPLVEGIPEAELIFNVVFFIVLTSVLLQGTTLPVVARWLGVEAPLPARRAYPIEAAGVHDGDVDLHEIDLPATSPVAGRPIVELGLPEQALVVLVGRGDRFVIPQGSTVLEPGDNVLLLADADTFAEVSRAIAGHPPGRA